MVNLAHSASPHSWENNAPSNRGIKHLALTVQEKLKRDPYAGDLYIFRGQRGDLVKILWHDGLGISLYAKHLDRGKFVWPSASEALC